MTQEIQKWKDYDKLEFNNQEFDTIDLSKLDTNDTGENIDFNTELTFKNCHIERFCTMTQLMNKKIIFKDCRIGNIFFVGTHFIGGLEMKNCVIEKHSLFDSIGHNMHPNEFIIDNCIFNEYIDFFDCYFEGLVKITNNNFRQGTNVGIYLQRPFGIKDEIEYKIENNEGDILKYSDKDLKIKKKYNAL